jgi:Uncharacterized conserved protein
MEQIEIHSPVIQLDQLLKWAGIIETGGQVRDLIADQTIFLNGKPVSERRKKIVPGDIIEITGVGKWTVTGPG